MKRCHAAMLAGLSLLLILTGACAAPPSPLVKDLQQVKPGMSLAQVETILGKYHTQEKESGGGAALPLGGIDKRLITYPLDDQPTSTSTEQRTYRARTRQGEWECAVIDFQSGRVADAHLLR